MELLACTKLAHKAVNCRKHWKWVDGMVPITALLPLDKRLPDLTHPATIGCLLSALRGLYGKSLFAEACGGKWRLCYHEGAETLVVVQSGETEAEVLVKALESAP